MLPLGGVWLLSRSHRSDITLEANIKPQISYCSILSHPETPALKKSCDNRFYLVILLDIEVNALAL
jgi:hypothetical protein